MRVSAFLLVLSFFIGVPAWAINPMLPEILRGDANGNGQVDISDPLFINTWLFNGSSEPPCVKAADANDDGEVNLADTTALTTYLFLGGPGPAAPFPYCGEDRTADGLPCLMDTCQ